MGPVLKNAGTNQVKVKIKVEVQPLINSAEFLGGASCLGQWPSVRGLGLVSQIPEFEIVFSCRTWHHTSSVTSLYVTRLSGQVLAPSVFDSTASKRAKGLEELLAPEQILCSLWSAELVWVPNLSRAFYIEEDSAFWECIWRCVLSAFY